MNNVTFCNRHICQHCGHLKSLPIKNKDKNKIQLCSDIGETRCKNSGNHRLLSENKPDYYQRN